MDLSITNRTKTNKGQFTAVNQHRKDNPIAQLPLRITIITVTYNSSHTIADTLESVKAQQYDNIEHIIVDGASTDNTIDIVRSYEHVSKYISEKDMGLYDAMNKGVQLATGDIIGILNSDDVYANPFVLNKVAEIFSREQTDTLYGDLDFVDPNNLDKVVRSWRSGKFSRTNFQFGWMPPHPTFFVRREVYEQTGLFNLSLRSAADYELMLRILFKHQYKTSYLKEVLVKMRVGGMSNGSWRKRLRANIEDRMAWKLNNLRPYFFTLYMKPVRKLFQFITPYLRLPGNSQVS
jgi:glycosyltransferase involved in cell wall biosynthesis